MPDREKLVIAIERAKEQSEEYGLDRILVDFKAADMILELLKEQEKRINELEEKLRLLEYGDQDTLQSIMMPAT